MACKNLSKACYMDQVQISDLLEKGKNYWSFLGLSLLVMAALTPWFIDYPEGFSELNSVYINVAYSNISFFGDGIYSRLYMLLF